MKKILPTIFILIIALAVIVPYSYSGNTSKQFFTISSEEVKAGDTLEMTINLNKIDYNQCKITLSTDLNVEDIYKDKDELELEIIDGELVINVNKEESSLEQITLFYMAPENAEADTAYTIAVTVTNQDNEEEQLVSTVSVKVVENDDKSTEEANKQDEEKQSDKENENKNGGNKENKNQNDNSSINNKNFDEMDKSNNNPIKNDEEMTKNINEASSKTESMSSKGTNTSIGSVSKNNTQETVTYNGSDNNYLSSLVVEGYELNKTFNKESATYFVTVDSSVINVSIEATAEDSNATVCVSGADNLKTGTNKVLISVTSESGVVRTYRIYVTKK